MNRDLATEIRRIVTAIVVLGLVGLTVAVLWRLLGGWSLPLAWAVEAKGFPFAVRTLRALGV